ncbi:MAG: type III secretion system export apparatus subunit SctS [Neisseriaceae bacterium]
MNYDVVYLAKQALMLSLILSLPVIIIASVIGLLFSIFQSLTQIQDQSLSFAIKLVFIIVGLYMTVDWMAVKIYRFALLLYSVYM